MKEDYFSTDHEPALHGKRFTPDPAETRVEALDGRQKGIDAVRDSVHSEPAVAGCAAQAYLGQWIAEKRSQCSRGQNLSVSLLAALLAGPFAVLGAFLAVRHVWMGAGYTILIGPIVEELLKQSGMIYLLERQPYRVFARWQFVFSAVLAALTFAAIENVLYTCVYVGPGDLKSWSFFVAFRWTVPTTMHLTASIIGSLGLISVWRRQQADGRAADLSVAFPYLVAAIAVHGAYNVIAIPLGLFLVR